MRRGFEALPGDDFSGGTSWLRTLGLLVLAVALISTGFVGFRKIATRLRRRTEAVDLPLLVFPVSDHVWPTADNFPIQPDVESTPQPAPIQSNNSGKPELVRVPSAVEGTLQLLPGRLEIASGNDRMKEIRFVKMPGPAVVTFGRDAGEAHTHIQVESPTVSRMHASMRFEAGRWRIKNLSGTNPVVVNGQQLPADDTELELNDGDQVEMGDMIFRFRSR